jgi:hypothetical protein
VKPARALALGLALAGATGARAGTPDEVVCQTVEGAPASTSEPLVVGMRERMAAGDDAGLQKYLDTGQTLLLNGGNTVSVIQRSPERGTVLVRRGARGLPFWTVETGIACASAAPALTQP